MTQPNNVTGHFYRQEKALARIHRLHACLLVLFFLFTCHVFAQAGASYVQPEKAGEQAWPNRWAPDLLIDTAETGERIRLKPETALAELERLENNLPLIREEIRKLNVDETLKARALAQLEGF